MSDKSEFNKILNPGNEDSSATQKGNSKIYWCSKAGRYEPGKSNSYKPFKILVSIVLVSDLKPVCCVAVNGELNVEN